MIEFKWKNPSEDKMTIQDKKGVIFLTYPALEKLPFLVHGFSTREGGVSEGIYRSMNLSFTRGDRDEAVQKNFQLMADALGIEKDSIVCSDQTHTTNVRKVSSKDCGNGLTRKKEFFDVDGMITDEQGVTLATFYADCVPLYFVDPVHKAIGLSHSGWRGTVHKMGKETIEQMTKAYGTDPADLITAIGPSICIDCYEVSEDVAEAFAEAFANPDKLMYKKENGKYQLNLWEANRQVLLEAGVQKKNISMPNLCTCCNPDLLFSHRASHGQRGNLAAFLALR